MTLPVNPYEPPQEEHRRNAKPLSRFAYTSKYANWGLFIGGVGGAVIALDHIGYVRDMQQFLGIVLPNLVLAAAAIGLFLGLIVGLAIDILRWERRPPRRQDEEQ